MASIQARTSRGKKYWSIVESRRINGQPRTVILEYLGTATTLLERLQTEDSFALKSYSHGDTAALINAAIELDIVSIINKYVPRGKNGSKPLRDGLTVGASLLLAALGRACHPTSKLGWYDWCQNTSLEYCLQGQFKNLDSQHFWDQMNALPVETIASIENEILQKLIPLHGVELDCLFFDTTNFFTFIATDNKRCDLPQLGKNKQHRYDLRQIGMALLVSRKEHFPLFRQTYCGNKNDGVLFKEIFPALVSRLRVLSPEISRVTLVFDKGNNSKANFKLIDAEEGLHYVGGLVSSYFKDLILEANSKFEITEIDGEPVPVYKIKREVWGKERTCVVTISAQLLEGQIRGIHQNLEKKFTLLNQLKQQLEHPKSRSNYDEPTLTHKIKKMIHGQFIDDLLKLEIFVLDTGKLSFSYRVDDDAFGKLKRDILGRKILVTNRHDWTSGEILAAYCVFR
jgi:transposase